MRRMHGRLTVVTGCMFAGKTDKLIEILDKDPRQAAVFKPTLDRRYSTEEVVSHSGKRLEANLLPQEGGAEPLWRLLEDTTRGEDEPWFKLVGIDEVQFLGPWIVEEVVKLLLFNVDVVVSGLDLTFKGEPFGVMPQLLCYADVVHKLCATCSQCGAPATRSFRTAVSADAVLVGGAESYEPRCLTCFS